MVEVRNRALTRRELLAGVLATGMGSLAGCEHDGPVTNEPEGIPIDPSPGWRANYDTYVRSKEESVHQQTLVRTSATLQYLDVTWEDVWGLSSDAGDDEPNGAWKHTFAWSSTGFTFFRSDSSDSWMVSPDLLSGLFAMNNRFAVNGHHEDPVIDDPRFVPEEKWTDDVAVSVRRDPDLHGFLDSRELERKLDEADQPVRDELTENPEGITTTNTTRIKREIEKNDTLTTYALTAVSWVAGLLVSAAGWMTGVGLVVSVTLSVITWIATDFSIFGYTPEPDLDYNKGVSNHASKRGRGRVVGHYALFDVYIAPDSTGQFTVQSQHSSSTASGGSFGESFDTLDSDSVRSLWTITVDPLPAKEQLTQTTSESNDVPESEKFTASIAAANFADRENETVYEDGELAGEAIVKPRPKPGIAGPLRKIPSGEPMTYSANETVLASSHVVAYRWRAYRVPETHWLDALQSVTGGNEIANVSEALFDRLTESLSPDVTARGEFPEITYEEAGRYLLTLEARDERGHRGIAMEFVDVDAVPPEPKITVEQSNPGETVLSAERTSVPEDVDLSYDWLVVGPISDLIGATAGTTGLFSTIGLLTSPTVREASGVEVPLSTERGTYVAILTVTHPSGTWVSTIDAIDAGLLFYDDWEDGTYTSDPEWTELDSRSDGAVEITDRETPDGGSKVLRIENDSSSAVNLVSESFEADLSQSWRLEGTLNPRQLPGIGEGAFDCTYHDVDVGVSPLRLVVSAYDPYDEAREPVRIVGHNVESTTEADPFVQEDEWYRYELQFDGVDTYTGRIWPASGSKDDGVTVTATGERLSSPTTVVLRASGDGGGGICGDIRSKATVEHAFVRLSGGSGRDIDDSDVETTDQ